MHLIWLIPLLPAFGALVNGVVGVRYFSKRAAGLLACATMAGALALSFYAFFELLTLGPEAREYVVRPLTWISALPLQLRDGTIGSFSIPWGFRLDPLSAMMILVVTGIGFLIHVYSVGYMHGESRGAYARFFTYLNLFVFFMLMLVLGDNFVVMFVGWEGVGLCSYLLIGYYYEKKSASDAGKKAFIVNRIGDWGFILGIFLIFSVFGTLDFRAVANAAGSMPVESAGFGTLSLITLLLFIGATGKSAQIPLYVWLPDAMEGPTPVSALIHAATMVTAGVYMVGRNAVLFSHSPETMQIVAIIGVATAFMAATIGLVQNDIKRVLAYSTVSQLGFMFLAMGVGAYAAGAFHLMTHAFFKALLFLCSGSVIHAMAGQQDMRHMGGLKKYLPVTYVTMLIGTLAIAGIPPLSGFFSKDEILFRAYQSNRIIWGVAVVTALMTAFYMYRLMSMTFFGTYRGPAFEEAGGHGRTTTGHGPVASAGHGAGHAADDSHGGGGTHGHAVAGHGTGGHGEGGWHGPHESPKSMTIPLMILAVGALLAGFVGVPAALNGNNDIEHFLEPSFVAQAVGAEHATASATNEARTLSKPATTAELAGTASHAAAPEGGEGGSKGAPASTVESHGEAATAAHAAAVEGEGEPHISWWGEMGLMAVSVLMGVIGIMVAYRFYVRAPEIADRLAQRWAGAHRVLSNKYYVDEFYAATAIAGTMASARGLWVFDAQVVDGAVNGTGWMTMLWSRFSHVIDQYVVDGLVNFVGAVLEEGSFVFRRLQTGLIQNYALVMLFGVFAFVSIYLMSR
ncbi:MAG: NADH-quinone oxidoreductase subunit L [Acidobacteria bacterium]|nr:NADH-quinone oxidoreductase subunit L [Acidobacteriota bacterium]